MTVKSINWPVLNSFIFISDPERARNESVATAQGSSNPLIGN